MVGKNSHTFVVNHRLSELARNAEIGNNLAFSAVPNKVEPSARRR
jgi:hypothetical protein